MDAIEKKIPAIDPNREALTGWSYGGFMTMFGVTQTTRFKAAVAGAGISDWQSYYGENSIDQWMLPFFGKTVYDDPAVYAKSSALTFIHNVKTPTMIIVGDRDGECPAPQSFEFWHALRAEDVKTQLIVYPTKATASSIPTTTATAANACCSGSPPRCPANNRRKPHPKRQRILRSSAAFIFSFSHPIPPENSFSRTNVPFPPPPRPTLAGKRASRHPGFICFRSSQLLH